jgi:hypothetical protein
MSLISPSDVAVWTNKPLTSFGGTACVDFLRLAIDALEGDLEEFLGRPLEQKTCRDVAVLLEGQCIVPLKSSPVITVGAVTVLPGNDIAYATVIPSTEYLVWPWGIEFADPLWLLVFSTASWGMFPTVGGTQVQIDYTAGLDGMNIKKLRGVMLRAASREYLAFLSDVQNVSNLRAGKMMDYAFYDSNAGGFTKDELDGVRRYKRRRVG